MVAAYSKKVFEEFKRATTSYRRPVAAQDNSYQKMQERYSRIMSGQNFTDYVRSGKSATWTLRVD